MLAIKYFRKELLKKVLKECEPPNLFLKNYNNKNAINLLNDYGKKRKYFSQKIIGGRKAQNKKKNFFKIYNIIIPLSEKQQYYQ